MAKNEVTLTLSGDTDQMEKSLQRAQSRVTALAKELGIDSSKMEEAFKDVGKSADRMADDIQHASRDAAAGFDRLSDGADRFETRAQGARDGLTGLEDSMGAVAEISRGNLLQGFMLAGSGAADLGSTVANFVGPNLKNLVTRLGAVRLALLGVAGVAGIAAAAILWFSTQGERAKITLEDISEEIETFLKTGGLFTGELRRIFGQGIESVDNFRKFVDALNRDDALGDLAREGFGQFDDALSALDQGLAEAIQTSEDYLRATEALRDVMGEEAFQEAIRLGLLDQFLAKGLDVVHMEALIADETTEVAEAFKLSSTNLKEFTDLLKAQTNPVFAYAKAEESVAAAQEAYNEAVAEYGSESVEANRAALDLLGSQLELEDAAAKANDTTAETVRQLQALAEGGKASAAGVAELERQLANAQARAKQMEQLRVQLIVEEVQRGGRNIENLNWRYIGQISGPGRMHDGGIVPGPVGQEVLAILQAGERVLPMDQAGGNTIVVHTGGNRMMAFLVDELRQAIKDQGGDVQIVLGS